MRHTKFARRRSHATGRVYDREGTDLSERHPFHLVTKVDQNPSILQRAWASKCSYLIRAMRGGTDWLAIVGLIFVTMITPGPNNALALRAGIARNYGDIGAVIAGVQLGGIVLLALCWAGVTALIQTNSLFAPGFTLIGGAYLAWLGLRLWRSDAGDGSAATSPVGTLGVAALQFANPKAWLFMATLGSVTAGSVAALGKTAALFVFISVACLGLWSAAGAKLSQFLSSAHRRRRFDQILGLLLIASAFALVAGSLVKVIGHAPA
jgi:threonine/homoserine/homoserine lactone efflux protein